jgi:hypothetical protein
VDVGRDSRKDGRQPVSSSPIPAADLETARAHMMLAYGSERNALLRTLHGWFNLTLLLSFAWPALVVFLDAPVVHPANTPIDWYALRLAAPLVVLAVAARLWRASGVPGFVARPERTSSLFTGSMMQLQVHVFLIGLSVVLGIVLLLSDASAAAKVMGLGLAEALAFQAIIPGYVKSTLEVFDAAPRRAFVICAALFGMVFGLRAALAAAIQPDAELGYILAAAIALSIAGAALGALFLILRDRSASLIPGIFLHWLVVAILPAAVG